MVGGGFQKFLQLFVAQGYCMFEDDVCVDPSGVLDRGPNYAIITFSKLFAGSCVDWLEVIDKEPNYATAFLSEFYVKARCPPVPAPSRVVAAKVRS